MRNIKFDLFVAKRMKLLAKSIGFSFKLGGAVAESKALLSGVDPDRAIFLNVAISTLGEECQTILSAVADTMVNKASRKGSLKLMTRLDNWVENSCES
ncbi:MAG: hypothetical protein JJW03_02135 [Desulfosarcina sp.]|nr:hypothetical protein [Desulfobacterales bacterium]